jgi:hypothetical protein
MLSDNEIFEYQSRTTWSVGDLVQIWDHEKMGPIYGMIVSDTTRTIEIPVTGKSHQRSFRSVREIVAIADGRTVTVSNWDIFPINEARPIIPF